jgi:hypothetical protein
MAVAVATKTVLVDEEVAIAVMSLFESAPSPPIATLQDSKLNGLRIEGTPQSEGDMAPVAADMLPAGHTLTAYGSLSVFMRTGQ